MNNTRFRLIRLLIVIVVIFGNLLWFGFLYQKLNKAGIIGNVDLSNQQNLSITNLNEAKIKIVVSDYNKRKEFEQTDTPESYQMKQELIMNIPEGSASSSTSSTSN